MFAKYFWAIFNFNSHVYLFYSFCIGLVKGFLILLPLQRTTSLFHWLLVSFLICISSSLVQYIPSLHSFQFRFHTSTHHPKINSRPHLFPEKSKPPQDSNQSENNKIQFVWCVCVCVLCACVHVLCVCVLIYAGAHTIGAYAFEANILTLGVFLYLFAP